MPSEDEVKADLERIVGPVWPKIWERLVTKDHVAEVVDGFADIDDLVTEYRELADLRADKKQSFPIEVKDTLERTRARSSLANRCLADNEAVSRWRDTWLPAGLLNHDQLSDWLRTRYKRSLPPDWPFIDPWTGEQPRKHGWPTTPTLAPDGQIAKWAWPDVETLAIELPDGEAFSLRVPPIGALSELVGVVASVESFGARESDVVLAVVCGVPLVCPSASASFTKSFRDPASNMVSLQLDPMMTPAQVAEAWEKVRGEVFSRSARQQSDKHLQLAQLRWDNPASSTPELKAEWNRTHPDWAYENMRHFRRDLVAATERWTDPGRYYGSLDWAYEDLGQD